MSDIATRLYQPRPNSLPYADWSVNAGQLSTDPTLETAVLLSMYTEADAPAGAWVPEGESPRRWWGQSYWPLVLRRLGIEDSTGLQLGSLLWRWKREKQTEATRAGIVQDTRDCLAWMHIVGLAASVEVEGDWIDTGVLLVPVEIVKPDGLPERYQHFWRLI
jgi:phage gp46-like protein